MELFKKLVFGVIRIISRFYYQKIYQQVMLVKREVQTEMLLVQIRSKGDNIHLEGNIRVTHPDHLHLGRNIHIGEGCFFFTDGKLAIGDNTMISRNVTIYTSNHDYQGSLLPFDEKRVLKPVTIGKNVWIGMNVCITPGVTIGDGAIIGLGAVIAKDVPDFAIVGNPPQRLIKYRDTHHYQQLEKEKSYFDVRGHLR